MPDLRRLFPSPIKIASIEVLRTRNHDFVRVTSSDGATGLVMSNGRMKVLLSMFKELIIPFFTGKDARDLDTLVDDVYIKDSRYKFAGMPFWTCVAHAELAILDMLGKIASKPAGQLLGNLIRKQIPIYVSSMRRDTTPEQEVEWVGKRVAETGATAVKLKIGGRMSNNADASPGRTERLVALARKTFGDNVAIYVDSNGSYDAPHAIEVGKMLQSHNVGFYEEPCPWEEYDQTKKVADALDITIAGGEQDSSLPRWKWIIANHCLDLVQPDIFYNGGLIRCRRVAALAAAAGMKITPHHPKVAAELAPMLQFASITPNLGPHQEFNGAPYQPQSWHSPAFDVRNGAVEVPAGPGLGVQYDPAIWQDAQIL